MASSAALVMVPTSYPVVGLPVTSMRLWEEGDGERVRRGRRRK
jgi:hypothetical protein